MLGLALIVVLSFSVRQEIEAQTKPLTYPEIITALNTKLPNKAFKTRTELISWLIAQINRRKLDKPLTADREDDLRQAGATGELIEAIRRNSPGSPTATTTTPTPVVKSMPTPAVKPTPTVGGGEMKNSIGTEFVKIPRGSFMMGSTDAEVDEALLNAKKYDSRAERERFSDELPKHSVTINYELFVGKYEVTIGEWEKVMGNLPPGMEEDVDQFKESNAQPVIFVSWNDAKEFIRKLNALNDGYEYRLPSEAEWEYAARAGTTTEFAFGASLSSTVANFDGLYPYGFSSKGKYLNKTVKVGSYEPNDWGLYDMHGNVQEWVEDVRSDGYGFRNFPVDGSPNVSIGDLTYRIIRGGSWMSPSWNCRSAERKRDRPGASSTETGFRLVARPK